MKMSSLAGIMVLVVFGLSGCNYIKAVTFDKDPNSGPDALKGELTKKKQTVSIFLIKPVKNVSRSTTGGTPMTIGLTPEQVKKLGVRKPLAACDFNVADPRSRFIPLAALAAPLVGFLVEQAVSYASDYLSSQVKKLVDLSKQGYGAKFVLNNPSDFSRTECLILIRGVRAKNGYEYVGLLFIAKVERQGNVRTDQQDSFILRPTFLLARSSVAITGRGKPIDVVVAIAGKQARTISTGPEAGNKKIEVFGEAAFTFKAVALGKPVSELPKASGLIALPSRKASALQINAEVTEMGSAVPDGAKAAAEIEALFKAIGPVLKKEAQKLVPATK